MLTTETVILHRPVSPSGKMIVLSRHLENEKSTSAFTVGTPPRQESNVTLSRKVQSELNLVLLGRPSNEHSVSRSLESGFSGKGDPLPDEIEPPPVMESAVDFEAFVALQELGTLVARKKGIDANKFFTGLTHLYSTLLADVEREPGHEGHCETANASSPESAVYPDVIPSTPERAVRHASSRPQLGSSQKRRRHFSFEPGDDQAAALEEKFRAQETAGLSSSDETETMFDQSRMSSLRSSSFQSKIPSPILRPGLENVRRERSDSSVRTALRRPDDERYDSRSSVFTAFRQDSSGSIQHVTQSRSSSELTPGHGDGHGSDSTGSIGVQHNVAAMAGARAVDQSDTCSPKTNVVQANSTLPATGSSSRAVRPREKALAENSLPHQRG